MDLSCEKKNIFVNQLYFQVIWYMSEDLEQQNFSLLPQNKTQCRKHTNYNKKSYMHEKSFVISFTYV